MARAMKDSAIEWIGQFPSSWTIKRIKNLALDMQRGVQPQYAEATNFFIANQACLSTYCFRLEKRKECEALEGKKGRYKPNDILIASTGEGVLGKCVLSDHPGYSDSHVSILRLKESHSPAFLTYFLSVNYELVNSFFAKGSTKQTELQRGDFLAHSIAIPSLVEQRRIAAWLDLQTTRIDKRRELLAKKRELLRDLRSNLVGETLASGLHGQETASTCLVDLPALPVGWQASHTKRLLRFITSGSRGWAEYYAEQGDIFLRIGNLTRETIDLDVSDLKYVALPAKAAEGKRTRLRPGDMLVSITADLGSIAVVPVLDKPAYVSQHIALCRPKEGVHPRWLGYAMVSPQAKRQLMNSGYGGTKIQLSLDDVRNVWQAVPPLDEQIEIADFLDQRLSKIARQITLIDQLDDLLKQQRKAIIHEAVTGKIDLSAVSLERVET